MADNPRPYLAALKRVLKFASDSAAMVAPLDDDLTCDDIIDDVQALEEMIDNLTKKTRAQVASEALQLVRANYMGVWAVCGVGEVQEYLIENLNLGDCDKYKAQQLWEWHKLRVLISQDWLGNAIAEHFENRSSSDIMWDAFSTFREDAPGELFDRAVQNGLLLEGMEAPDFKKLAEDHVALQELIDAIKAAPVA